MDVRRAAPAAALAVLALVAACTTTTGGRGAAAAGAAPPGLEAFYDQDLSWGPCVSFAVTADDAVAYADPALDCGRVTVPLDYAQPGGETATIAVLRKRATGDRIGSLLINPGGPGASGMSFAPSIAGQIAGTPLAERFDLVGFDPRGVGSSEPAIDCETDAERDEERADIDVDGSPEGVAVLEADSQEFVDRCVERVGVDVLANVGTRDVVRDLDVVRAALGDDELTFLGYSYGTFIGAKYAQAFPRNVRALVLDGAVDPAQSAVESAVAQNAGFQLAFDAFAADCTTQPGCALGTDPAQAVDAFRALVLPLYDAPAAVPDGRTLGYADAMTGVIQALYSEQLWEPLRLGLSELTAGQGRVLMLLADLYESRADDGTYDDSLEAFPVISCLDEERLTDPAVFLEIDTRAREVAPFRDDGRGPTAARPPCAFWPVPPTTEPSLPSVEGLPPVLVISVTGDPATPYEAGVRLADQIGGVLLSVEGNQHTVALSGVPCVDDVVTRYLVDLEAPDDGTSCTI
ncbi:alpha/beta hydrolase [Pseudonocardia sp. KRD-184]|uniref:Alpha/beta hydrolase n=1 Tax=Pseudonocardia oceani TaxID=2792013 RepID=A0ABS6UEW1_9PSEU|nr:alpha/beta hydrolase [Pseudonocardia oceani]MBW0088207.1 alpha/beta hydrolase [Pseudonocardia oceani]MBW0094846.1 alpha/beta hydrolase [Pseudonocardia oceani]MBW0107624.1 alpha/beta hydrolase [Pseudonocardia oceani]MBW0120993.1 alpha/beta hydrolase [Pseudonocardia oceani]MBW0130468.1 alpha/beta hydrolase [Pseudonocardia oceani]